MIEIIYENGKYRFIHDGETYTFKNLRKHLSKNGHKKEKIGFGVSNEVFDKCHKITKNIESIFK